MRPRAFETAVKEIERVYKQFGTARLGFVEGVVMPQNHSEEAHGGGRGERRGRYRRRGYGGRRIRRD